MTAAINIADGFSRFSEQWSPKLLARLNDYDIKIARLEGEFIWHTHPDTDELFLVIDGMLTIQLRDGDVAVSAGELFVVPRGVEHCPKASSEARIMLIEPTGVVNTGDATGSDRTAALDETLLYSESRHSTQERSSLRS